MTAFAAITLADGVPANHVFNPSSIDSAGVAHLYTAGSTGFDSREQVSLLVKLPKNGGSVARVTAKVSLPIMDSVDNTLKLGECIGTVEFVMPKYAPQSQREMLLDLVTALLADASVVAAVGSLESIY